MSYAGKTPEFTTQDPADSSDRVATTGYVDDAIASVVEGTGFVLKTGDTITGTLIIDDPQNVGISTLGSEGLVTQSDDLNIAASYTTDGITLYVTSPEVFSHTGTISSGGIYLNYSDLELAREQNIEIVGSRISLTNTEGGITYPASPGSPENVTTKSYVDSVVAAAIETASSAIETASLPYKFSMSVMPVNTLYNCLLFDGTRFLALSYLSTFSLASSSDGVSWLATGATGLPANGYGNLRFLNGLYFATNAGTTTTSLYATANFNGAWVARTLPVGGVRDIAYGANKYVIASSSGSPNRLYHSSDSITWTVVSTLTASYTAITFNGTKFVATGFSVSGVYVATSTDGINWTESLKLPGVTLSYGTLVSGNGILVALYSNGVTDPNTCIYSINNGVTWSASPLTGLNWEDIVYEPSSQSFIAVAQVGFAQIKTIGITKDFVSWKYSMAPGGSGGQVAWSSLEVGNGVIVGVAAGGTTGANNRAMVSNPISFL